MNCESCDCPLDIKAKIDAMKPAFESVCNQCGLPPERRKILLAVKKHYDIADHQAMKHCFFVGGYDLSALQVKERTRGTRTKGTLIEWFELGAFLDGCLFEYSKS